MMPQNNQDADAVVHNFLNILKEALSVMEPRYYGVDAWYAINVSSAEQRRKYPERVFCYELYHQIRTMMKPDTPANVMLHAELTKDQINELIGNRLAIKKLSGKYCPDFLLHQPTTAHFQCVVMEVKCNPRLRFDGKQGMHDDLCKLNDFIENYHYKVGIFLTVNTEVDQIEKILQNSQKEIALLQGRDRIRILCKYSHDTDLVEFNTGGVRV